MSMLALAYDNLRQRGDLVRDAGLNLETGDDLETAVLASVFTERRAEVGDAVEPTDLYRGGWHGDTSSGFRWGSRLWTLRRSKATRDTLNLARTMIEESLAWMLEDDVAESIVVTTYRGERGVTYLGFTVEITRPGGTTPWSGQWEARFNVF